MNKVKKLTTSISALLFTVSTTVVHAAGGSGDVGSSIDSWGNTIFGLLLKIFKWAGLVALVSIGIFLFFNNDETNAKRAKTAFFIILAACFVGWFAEPIYNTFVK